MNLEKKKLLAIRTLGVGKDRILFNLQRLDEIKEAITKQDIRDLVVANAIIIRPIHGRKKVEKRKRRRGMGRVRKKVVDKKRIYMVLTRKLRAYLFQLLEKKAISRENYSTLRKEIRASLFRSLSHFKERIQGLTK